MAQAPAHAASAPPPPGDTAAGGSDRVFVMPLVTQGVSEAEAARIEARLLFVLKRDAGGTVLTSADAGNIAGLADATDRCGADSACLGAVAEKLEAARYLAVRVSPVGGQLVLQAQLVRVEGAVVLARISDPFESADALVEGCEAALAKLLEQAGAQAGAQALAPDRLAEGPSFAVMDIDAPGIEPGLAQTLSNVVVLELKQIRDASVISRSEIETMLQFETQRQQLGCTEEGCLAELGNALGVDYLVSGSLSRVAEQWMMQLKVLDIREVRVVARGSESFRGPADDLLVAVRFLVARLFTLPIEGEGELRLRSNVADAALTIDGREAGTVGAPAPSTMRLPAGKLLLEVQSGDHFPFARDAYVEPGRVTRIDALLEPLPTPWYKTWWFWTIAGVVVAAGAAGTAVGVTRQKKGSDTGTLRLTLPDLPARDAPSP